MFSSSNRLRIGIEGAIFAALAIVLSLLPTDIGSSFTISLGMIPMTLYALKRGFVPAAFAGFLWGLLHLVTGKIYFLSRLQFLIEYFVAFIFVCFAGLFAKKLHDAMVQRQHGKIVRIIIIATFAGTFARFFWHFVAGYIYWGEYALWGMGPLLFSLVANGTSALLTAAVTSFVLVVLEGVAPKLFLPDGRSLLKNKKS